MHVCYEVRSDQGKARQGKARQGKARQGKERKGKERKGKERKGKAVHSSFSYGAGLTLAIKDLPMPGGPYSSTPAQGDAGCCQGCLKGGCHSADDVPGCNVNIMGRMTASLKAAWQNPGLQPCPTAQICRTAGRLWQLLWCLGVGLWQQLGKIAMHWNWDHMCARMRDFEGVIQAVMC